MCLFGGRRESLFVNPFKKVTKALPVNFTFYREPVPLLLFAARPCSCPVVYRVTGPRQQRHNRCGHGAWQTGDLMRLRCVGATHASPSSPSSLTSGDLNATPIFRLSPATSVPRVSSAQGALRLHHHPSPGWQDGCLHS